MNAGLGRAGGAQGLFYPPDPSSFETCTIGGNLATNAGGMRCLKYGVNRDSVMALELVLANGSGLNTGSRTTKDVAGDHLQSLVGGTEGTLGAVTLATHLLRAAPLVVAVTYG